MQIRCNFPDISYLSETQKNNFQFLTQSQTADKPMALREIATQQSRDTRKTN